MLIDLKVLSGPIIAVALFIAGCGDANGPGEQNAQPSSEPPPAVAAPESLTDIFPEGLGRSMVLDSCGACHAAACAAIGQRTEARWASLKGDHRDKLSDMDDADYDVLFAYLSDNFNDGKPEPVVPPQFLEGGCTPF